MRLKGHILKFVLLLTISRARTQKASEESRPVVTREDMKCEARDAADATSANLEQKKAAYQMAMSH